MQRLSVLGAVSALFVLFFAQAACAQLPTVCSHTDVDCLPRPPTVSWVRTHDLSADDFTSFYLVSYGNGTTITPQDGAAGLFVRATSCTRADDGGAVLHDNHAGPDCFYRQNLNGDLRQWGVTQGSAYARRIVNLRFSAGKKRDFPHLLHATSRLHHPFARSVSGCHFEGRR